MEAKITNPTKPSECTAALSMSEKDADHPYASILYTAHEGTIRFFGLVVDGIKEDGENKMLTYAGAGTNPDEAIPLISGTLTDGLMHIDADGPVILHDLDNATDFVSMIRMVYSMEAQGA